MSSLITVEKELLSELISEIQYKQVRGKYGDFMNCFTNDKKYCALGGVAKNLGATDFFICSASGRQVLDFISQKLDITRNARGTKYECPKCGVVRKLFQIVTHLNDSHTLSFKEISNILLQIKPTQKPETLRRRELVIQEFKSYLLAMIR